MSWVEIGGEVDKDLSDEERTILKSFNSWYRAKEILKTNNFFLYEKIEVEDIHQGDIGNCYFLSSISAIAEYGERFFDVFITKSRVENGCYQIKFLLNGIPKIICVDDNFPCRSNRKIWNVANSGPMEIWVQILEKAWAKVNGSYASTIAGLPSEAFSVLTEAPCFSYINRKFDQKEMWDIIKEADQNDYIICTNSKGDVQELTGIVKGHAYTIINAYDCNEKIKLLKLRNPWGSYEWKGDFSDDSPLWTNELRKLVNFQSKDDGIFYMKIEDFLKYFPYTFICKYQKNFFYEFKKFEQKNRDDFISCKFQVDENTKTVITLHQKQARFYRKIKNYKPAYGSIILAKYDIKKFPNYEYYGSSCSNQDKIHFELENLPVGEYHIFTNINWEYGNNICKYVISLYSSRELKLEKLNSGEIPSNYLLQILNSFLDKNIPKENINAEISSQISVTNNHTGFYMMKFMNLSKDRFLKISLETKSNNKLYLCKLNFDGLITLEDSEDHMMKYSKYDFLIGKNSTQIIAWKLLDHPGHIDFNIISCNSTLSQEIPSVFNTKKDPILLFIQENIDNSVKQTLAEDLFLKEIEYYDMIIFVLINKNNENSYYAMFKFINCKNIATGNREQKYFVEVNSMKYFTLKKLNPVDKCEYDMSYSVKIKH